MKERERYSGNEKGSILVFFSLELTLIYASSPLTFTHYMRLSVSALGLVWQYVLFLTLFQSILGLSEPKYFAQNITNCIFPQHCFCESYIDVSIFINEFLGSLDTRVSPPPLCASCPVFQFDAWCSCWGMAVYLFCCCGCLFIHSSSLGLCLCFVPRKNRV